MTLEQQLRWLDGHISLAATGLPHAGATGELSLAPMRSLMTLLGDPHGDAPAVHITGTNGKGSTAHLTSVLLLAHGLRVGTYGSPHVSRINERVQLDVQPIDDDALADAIEVVRLVSEQGSGDEVIRSWFELLTASAYRAFSDAAVDAAVIEVGMLGRFDATNVIDAQVAVVTNIAKDHTDGLAGWEDKIAAEKSGIVTAGRPLIVGEIDDDLMHYFVDESPSQIVRLGDNLIIGSNLAGLGGRVIDLTTPHAEYRQLFVSLHGEHQGLNLALAVAAAECFLDGPLDRDLIDEALIQVTIPARFEVVSTEPLIIIDGGHNPAGARTTSRTFSEDFHIFGRRILVVGMMAEKDPVEMLTALEADQADLVVCCEPDWPRAMKASELGAAARSMGLDPDIISSPSEAIEQVLSMSSEGDAILVAGSLYVAGAVRNRLLVDVD